jgi:type VI secretion system secreted protein VgrG
MTQRSASHWSPEQGVELSIECDALPPVYQDTTSTDYHVVISGTLHEAVSRPTVAQVELCVTSTLDEPRLLGKTVVLCAQHGKSERRWALVIEALRYIGFRDGTHRYFLELTHPLAQLVYRSDVRMFREKTLRQIAETVLAPCGVTAGEITWKVDEDPTRDYVVQYRENDLAFFDRILGEEGVNYLCTERKGKAVVLIADAVADVEHADIGDQPLLAGAKGAGVTDFEFEAVVSSGVYTTDDYHYLAATAPLLQSDSKLKASVGEWYEYPGGFSEAGRGATLTARRAEAQVSQSASATGRSECAAFEPGKYFKLSQIRKHGERQWLLVEVSHRWLVRREGTRTSDEPSYSNAFRCVPQVPFYRQFRSQLSRTVEGPVGAIVTTRASEEIQTEKYGEAKACFFWDRLSPHTDESSCWLRVIQIPIGGSLAIARKDWEILVRHLYGDPNRPLLMARLDNAGHPAPYVYPAAGTGMAWKTQASPGAEKINEFAMEDASGRQGFSMNAGTDYTCQVNNNMTEQVVVNEEVSVDVDHTISVTADQKKTIGATWTKTVSKDTEVNVSADRSLSVGAAETVTVSGSLAEMVVGSDTETVGASYMALAGMNVSRSSIGNQSLTVGGVLITAAGKGVSVAVGGAKSETIGGAKLVAAGAGISESVVGNFAMTVGGVIANAAGGNCTSSTKADSKVKVGGVSVLAGGKEVQVHAKTITIEVGAAAVFGAGGMLLTPASGSFVGMVTIKASGALKIVGAPNLPG